MRVALANDVDHVEIVQLAEPGVVGTRQVTRREAQAEGDDEAEPEDGRVEEVEVVAGEVNGAGARRVERRVNSLGAL